MQVEEEGQPDQPGQQVLVVYLDEQGAQASVQAGPGGPGGPDEQVGLAELWVGPGAQGAQAS